jgi:hypothetical protein
MSVSTARKRVAMTLVLAALCGVVADCIGDMKAQAAQQLACQVRYHGGPRSDSTRTTNCTSSDKSA